jgi:acetyl-CoA carboxylase biotin carboxyl carrier protein
VRYGLSDVEKVLEAFDCSDWDEIHLSGDNFELHVVARGAVGTATGRTVSSPPRADPPSGTVVGGAERDAVTVPRVGASGEGTVVAATAAVGPAIVAPSLGCFYRSPGPGAAPFVEVGDRVEAGTTVCIVEVMKLMHPVVAGLDGVVSAIHVGNGEAVVKGQVLFTVRVD